MRVLDGEQFLELLDILCFDPATECEQDLTIPCSPSSEHGSSLCLKMAEEENGISFLWASLNERRVEGKQLGGQR